MFYVKYTVYEYGSFVVGPWNLEAATRELQDIAGYERVTQSCLIPEDELQCVANERFSPGWCSHKTPNCMVMH